MPMRSGCVSGRQLGFDTGFRISLSWMGMTPSSSISDSVNVPVCREIWMRAEGPPRSQEVGRLEAANTLSKQMMSTPPVWLMCFALRQNILFFFNLFWAKAVTEVNAAGSIGGTTNEAISREFRIISLTVPWCKWQTDYFLYDYWRPKRVEFDTPFTIQAWVE